MRNGVAYVCYESYVVNSRIVCGIFEKVRSIYGYISDGQAERGRVASTDAPSYGCLKVCGIRGEKGG